MAVAQLAHRLIVTGSAPSDFFYTEPMPMGGANAIYVVIGCFAFTGSGGIYVWPQISDELDNWGFLGGQPPNNPLLKFSGVETLDATVSPASSAPYNVTVGARWVRFVFQVAAGASIKGLFAVRANSVSA